MKDWLGTIKDCMSHSRERRIGRDSDGNCYRISYEPGSEEKIARFMQEYAPEAMSNEGLTSMLVEQLAKYETRAVEGELRTS